MPEETKNTEELPKVFKAKPKEVALNYMKGIWTLNEVIELIQKLGFKVHLNGDSHALNGSDLHSTSGKEE